MLKTRFLLAVVAGVFSFSLVCAQPAAPVSWPAVKEVAALHEAKNYAGVRRVTAGLAFDPTTQANLEGARLFYYRGDALFRELHQARAQQAPEAETPVAPGRASFELSYDAARAKALETALADLGRAVELDALHGGSSVQNIDGAANSDFLRALGLAAMEKALFVTQDPTDFYAASDALSKARTIRGGSFGAFSAEAENALRGNPQLLALEVMALMAQGKESDARDLFIAWRKTKDAALRPQLAVGALAAAYDLVGEYERTRAFLLTMAVQQVQADGGKYDPAKHAATRDALRAHLANLGFALQMKSAAQAPVLRRVRVSGALFYRGQLTDEERAYVLAVPELKAVMWLYRPAQAGQLRAIRLKLESKDVAEQTAARAALEAGLKINPHDDIARALRGRCLLQAGETEAAIAEFSGVIARDTVMAGVIGALNDRAAAYTKLGRASEASADTRMAAQFENLLGRLASP